MAAAATVGERRYLAAPEPWSARAKYRSTALAAVAAAVVGVCWYRASDRRTPEDQAGWLIGSVLGAALFALVGAIWIIAGFRTVRRGMRDLAADKQAFALANSLLGQSVPTPPTAGAGSAGPQFVTAAGMVRAHRPDCLLVEGKQVRAVTHTDNNLHPCGVCLP